MFISHSYHWHVLTVPQTYATTVICILNLLLNPNVFKKARAEIDRVVGLVRLPALSDREKLPYIDCLVEETHRWQPISPIGISICYRFSWIEYLM
jgi:cytochrome P450